jgi:MFS family permease
MSETSSRWLVVTGCFTAILTGPVLVSSTFSVFFATLLDSQPWSRTAIAFAFSLYVVVYGFSGPIVGRWCERFGPKKVVLAGAVSFAVGFALLGIARHVWQFCVMYGLLGITAGMTGIVPVTTLVFRWFAASRGLAMGAASSGTLGGLFLSPLAYLVVEQLGWRAAYPVLGTGAGLLLFGVTLVTVEDTPHPTTRGEETRMIAGGVAQTHGPEIAPTSTSGDFTLGEAVATQRFWLLTASGFLFLGALTGLLAHAVPLARDRGLPPGMAAVALGLIVGLGPAGKLGFGYLADRYRAKKALTVTFLIQVIALLLLLVREDMALFWAFVIVLAVGQGGALALAPVVLGDLFGSTFLGSVVGVYWLVATAGSLVGPPLAASLREGAGSYFPVLVMFAAAMLCAAALTGMIREESSPVGQPLLVSTRRPT